MDTPHAVAYSVSSASFHFLDLAGFRLGVAFTPIRPVELCPDVLWASAPSGTFYAGISTGAYLLMVGFRAPWMRGR